MPYIISAVAVGLLCYAGFNWLSIQLRQKDAVQRRRALMRAGFVLLAVIIVVLTATGRLHWIGALIAAMIPVMKYILGIALRILPFINRKGQARPEEAVHSQPRTTELSREEALKVLGLDESADREQIIDAHRKLMQKVHPDMGGSDDLAARINEAKRILLA